MPTVAANLKQAELEFQKAGIIGSARLDSLVLLEYAARKERSWLLAHPQSRLNPSTQTALNKLVRKRSKYEPIAYLIGHKEFYGLDFVISPDVLIPRPETEAVVELALGLNLKTAQVLDMGTGCGAIAIAVAKNRPGWQITATDISPAALGIAQRNARKYQVKINFIESDLFGNIQGQFDLICANLPYIRTDAKLSPAGEYEPTVALQGGRDGLDIYRSFFKQLPHHLVDGGQVIIEADPRQHQHLADIAGRSGYGLRASQDFALIFG